MLYERAGGLTRPLAEAVLAEAVLADFAVHPDGSRLVVVRPTDDPDSALLLLDRAGRLLRRLDPGDLGAGFVPPPNGRAEMRFVDDTTLRYDTGEGPWLLDVETGRASPGAAR